jgi:hypothetical protein
MYVDETRVPAYPPTPQLPQHVLWSMQKGHRTAHARYLVGPATLLLQVLVGPDLVRSAIYEVTEVEALTAAANTDLAALRRDGWAPIA